MARWPYENPKNNTKFNSILGNMPVLYRLVHRQPLHGRPSPVIFYSDLTSGPNTGGQNNQGVFVTIWGNNFGSSQGSSSITVGGGALLITRHGPIR